MYVVVVRIAGIIQGYVCHNGDDIAIKGLTEYDSELYDQRIDAVNAYNKAKVLNIPGHVYEIIEE